MEGREPLIEAFADAAEAWADPEHEARAEAVARTLECENPFTEEAVAFAVNQRMRAVRPEALRAWLGDRRAAVARTVAVVDDELVPLAGLRDLLAVVLCGHRYRGRLLEASPYLLPAFVDDVRARALGLEAAFGGEEKVLAGADAVIARGDDETLARVAEACESRGIPPARRLLTRKKSGVAVLDGSETEEEREGIAEDVLLHEGHARRGVALIWAPRGLSPDPLLDAFAHFRAVFPAHPSTPGALKMQQAFLAATGRPHAYGEGLEFLVSRGEPEVQAPGHVRWSEYDDPADVTAWLREHAAEIEVLVARPHHDLGRPSVPPGEAHRPPIGTDDEAPAFLATL